MNKMLKNTYKTPERGWKFQETYRVDAAFFVFLVFLSARQKQYNFNESGVDFMIFDSPRKWRRVTSLIQF